MSALQQQMNNDRGSTGAKTMKKSKIGAGSLTRNSGHATEIHLSIESKDLEHIMKMKDTERERDYSKTRK